MWPKLPHKLNSSCCLVPRHSIPTFLPKLLRQWWVDTIVYLSLTNGLTTISCVLFQPEVDPGQHTAAVSRFRQVAKAVACYRPPTGCGGQSQEDQNARDWGLYQEGSRLLGKMQGYVQGHTPLETDRTCHLDYSDQGFMKGNATNPLMSTICEGQGTSGCTIQIKKKGSVSWCYDPPGGFTQHFGSFWCYWLPNLKWRFTWRMEFPKFIFMGEFLFFCRSYTLHPSRNMNMLCACESKILEENIHVWRGVKMKSRKPVWVAWTSKSLHSNSVQLALLCLALMFTCHVTCSTIPSAPQTAGIYYNGCVQFPCFFCFSN